MTISELCQALGATPLTVADQKFIVDLVELADYEAQAICRLFTKRHNQVAVDYIRDKLGVEN